jgi:hypothetical protein
MSLVEHNSIYVFDTSTIYNVFNHYFVDRFPTFWDRLNAMVSDGRITSVREAKKELDAVNHVVNLKEWLKENSAIFSIPTNEELEFISKIYSIKHFQQNLERKKLLHGGAFADPFIIAKAKVEKGIVVSAEKYKVNATKIPNICKHFNIEHLDLEGFLTKESWTF